jgi:hypothetical protein
MRHIGLWKKIPIATTRIPTKEELLISAPGMPSLEKTKAGATSHSPSLNDQANKAGPGLYPSWSSVATSPGLEFRPTTCQAAQRRSFQVPQALEDPSRRGSRQGSRPKSRPPF